MFALISVPYANLYETANSTLPRSDELLYGTLLQVLKILPASWYYVETFYHYRGYIKGANLLPFRKIDFSSGELMLVSHSFCDILSAPSVKSSLLSCLPRGSYVFVLEHEDREYAKIFLFNGQIGYCRSRFLTSCPDCSGEILPEEALFRKKVCDTALSYLGTSYRWGGKSPQGIDCSGLTFMAYYLNGVIIYRDAKIKNGFPVGQIPSERKKPGDLLYFPGHAALYLGGDQYIHSSAGKDSGEVVINSLNPLHSQYRKDLHENLIAVGSIFPLSSS